MAAMVPSPRHRHWQIQQLANMLPTSLCPLNENIIVFTMYLLAILRHNASWMHHAKVFAGCIGGWH
jgi:hypothetical protein